MLKIISKRKFISIKDFTIIEDRKIGCGSFGTVKLARHKNTCRMFAMKIVNDEQRQISLKDMPSETQVKLVERQIKLHSQLDHPHIIKLWDTILDNDMIYMIMEYAENGNLFYFQNTKNVFGEAEAFKFFCQTLDGIKYLHENDIIHRDLKPENLLLDSFNNIKICDFGWCAEDIRFKRTTFCGTYEYMAPEMLFKTEYDYRVDIWALGVLLYELLHGYAPFKGKNAQEVQDQMLKGGYEIDRNLSENVKNLIQNILQFQPEKRLSIEEIFKHPWIKDMESSINVYLKAQNAFLPKEIHQKIAAMPNNNIDQKCATFKLTKFDINKHRKNNSLNFQESGRNININLEINNFAIMSKNAKNNRPNNFHSQEKQKENDEFDTLKEAYATYNQSSSNDKFKKYKGEAGCKTQMNQNQIDKIIERVKGKQNKISKELLNSEKDKKKNHESQIYESMSNLKKKYKFRKSQEQIYGQKYPIRFNTEANEKDEWYDTTKLKKSVNKSKILCQNKSVLRMPK